jgi:hypothetical protein
MSVAEDRLDAWSSTPIINVISPEQCGVVAADCARMMFYRDPPRAGHVQHMKHRLGRQSYCWTGEYRFWVWELFGNKVRIFASDIQGVSFEVAEGQTGSAAVYLWKQYIGAVGPR